MKTYRRILVSLANAGETEVLLQRAAGLAHVNQAQLLVVRVLDTRSGFEADGPAASLPEAAASRRAPETKRRLDLLLAQNDLGWAESLVVWGDPKVMIAKLIRTWEPDLIVAGECHLPRQVAHRLDTLEVRSRSGFSRLLGGLIPASPSPRLAGSTIHRGDG
jgi:nucleotide-binding universal stress UspA family protein